MERPSDSTQLVDVFGPPAYNNFGEPRPFTNTPGCLIGFTTAFLVCLPQNLGRRFGDTQLLTSLLGAVMAIRLAQALRAAANSADAWFG